MENRKTLIKIGIAVLILVIALWINPFAFNNAGERTVVTTINGDQFVRFESGAYWQGLFAKETVWPNQISVQYKDSIPGEGMDDNTVDIGEVNIRFNDATRADVQGIAQYILPSIEKEMIEMNNVHRTPLALVKKRLAPYTMECLQSSAQLMSSEMHYSGGRAQMVQDYIDQLRNGAFLLKVVPKYEYDSSEHMNKRLYLVENKTDKNGNNLRKFSSIKEYGISVGDAQVTMVDYEAMVDNLLAAKIRAAAKASTSKQLLMTAQQEALTAAAQGQKKLVETEYAQKVSQTTQVVAAQTKVELAKTYSQEQQEAAKAAVYAAQKVRTDADAEAYKNSRMVAAGLTPWDKADFDLKKAQAYAEALGKIQLPSVYMVGDKGGNSSSILDALLSSKLLDK
jgi:hypothetical protein